MARSLYQRFAVTMSGRTAAQIESICDTDEQNHSEVSREGVGVCFASKSSKPQFHILMDEEERKGNPFHTFSEWDSEADYIFDTLR